VDSSRAQNDAVKDSLGEKAKTVPLSEMRFRRKNCGDFVAVDAMRRMKCAAAALGGVRKRSTSIRSGAVRNNDRLWILKVH
jgi:hypothetical protein